jgi:hypothetical protein
MPAPLFGHVRPSNQVLHVRPSKGTNSLPWSDDGQFITQLDPPSLLSIALPALQACPSLSSPIHCGSWDAVAITVVGIVVDSRTVSWLLWCFFLLGFDIVMVVGRFCCCLSCCRR